MTREELKELAKKHVYCLDEEYKKSHNLSDKQIEEIFFAGAEITQINLINKACEWMDCYIDNYLFIDAENNAGIKWDDFINDFRKAMKGEQI